MLLKGPYISSDYVSKVFCRFSHRIAVVGSGPAGFYAASRVMQQHTDVAIDMYERLPVPYGLVRYGVAPDHPEVKYCEHKFAEIGSSPRFNFIGNVEVGRSLPLKLMKPHYDAILLAYGAGKDKRLNIPGENLDGVFSARAFVGWYNGQPDYANLKPRLDNCNNAVVIGQGNVSLDITRILLSDVDSLRRTDITEEALQVLSRSQVKNVEIFGRRDLLQASFTNKEVRELMELPSAGFYPTDSAAIRSIPERLTRQQRRLLKLICDGSQTSLRSARTSWSLRFLLSPSTFLADHQTSRDLIGIAFKRNKLETDPTCRSPKAVPVIDPETSDLAEALNSSALQIPTSLAFRSIGYAEMPLPGLVEDLGVYVDSQTGAIGNDGNGRVLKAISREDEPSLRNRRTVPGLYVTGWARKGPSGVIASTMVDAFLVADTIGADLKAGRHLHFPVDLITTDKAQIQPKLGWEVVQHEVMKRGLRSVSWKEWQRMDEVERNRGKQLGKEREKLTTVKDMLNAVDQ